MPGMSSGLQPTNATIVSAFHSMLLHQGLVVLALLAIVIAAWNVLRTVQLRRAVAASDGPASAVARRTSPADLEPVGRRLLRIGFGLLWIFDGVLQAQASMPLAMAPRVIKPTAAASPAWVQHLVNVGGTIWNDHPIAASASAVWIQVGVGLLLLVAPRGRWSRLAGLASLGWGALVWIFGESFGGIFAPGLSWLFGAPGAVVFYALAGVLLALPERYWTGPRLGRGLLRVMGSFFVGMALLQAWPGRGYWQGHLRGSSTLGTLPGMVRQMAATPQPGFLSSWVASFAAFDVAHGFAVNLFVVVALGAIGLALLTGRVPVVRVALAAAAVLCIADWLLVEDLGFLGGVGTDPNSMIPMLVVLVAGYLCLTRVAVRADTVVPFPAMASARVPWRERVATQPAYVLRSLAALGAVAVTLLGAAPMAIASTNPNADPILAQAIDGTPSATDIPAPHFQLVDQYGTPVTLARLRGRTIALTFLDPVCVSDCPIIAQEFKDADRLLGGDAHNVELVAVVVNPLYRARAYLNAFDRQEGLDGLRNWMFLTGSAAALKRVWNAFGEQVAYSPGGAMIAHSDIAYVIDAAGFTRYVLNTDPGPGTTATRSSFAVTLTSSIEHVIHSS
ncbi:MAG TPA: SCO family protein [Acidimicrobiales bacterium]|nr:SCO family protein [Acidimicrobiales bacterium]